MLGSGKIRGASSTLSYSYHKEQSHGVCNPIGCGWSLRDLFNKLTAGCKTCASAKVHAHADFSYRGFFDPTGNLFYNHLSTYPEITGAGRAACRQEDSFRRKIPSVGPVKFFTWFHGCSLV